MRICVYGAASDEIHHQYLEDGFLLGREMAKRGHELVFGGGRSGMMGAVSRGALSGGGRVLGIAPRFFDHDGILEKGCTEFLYPENMRERKMMMERHSDAFVVTAGGIGTMDEFFEILTLRSLGRHDKDIALLNTLGVFDPLDELIRHGVRQGLVKDTVLTLYQMYDTPEELLDGLEG